jgi:hypothetical protein
MDRSTVLLNSGGESRYFETHKSDMFGEWEIPIDILGDLLETSNGQSVNHDPDFDWLSISGELMQSLDCLVECSSTLNHIVVLGGVVGIDGYAQGKFRMPLICKLSGIIRPRESPAIG